MGTWVNKSAKPSHSSLLLFECLQSLISRLHQSISLSIVLYVLKQDRDYFKIAGATLIILASFHSSNEYGDYNSLVVFTILLCISVLAHPFQLEIVVLRMQVSYLSGLQIMSVLLCTCFIA